MMIQFFNCEITFYIIIFSIQFLKVILTLNLVFIFSWNFAKNLPPLSFNISFVLCGCEIGNPHFISNQNFFLEVKFFLVKFNLKAVFPSEFIPNFLPETNSWREEYKHHVFEGDLSLKKCAEKILLWKDQS